MVPVEWYIRLIAEAPAMRTPLVGKTLQESRLRETIGINVVGLWERGQFIMPSPQTVINPTTVLLLAGSEAQFGAFDRKLDRHQKYQDPVLILGGGRVGRAAAAALHERIGRLDAELRSQLMTVRDTPYIVFHDAYQLFEQQYGLNAVGSVVISPGRMPGARRVHEMRERLVQSGAKCIFSEPQFDPGLIATIVEGTAVRTGTLDPIGVDLEPGDDAWFDLMRNLANALAECLGD